MCARMEVTTVVTLLFHSIRFVLYYFHERWWDGINWGLKNNSQLSDKEKEILYETEKAWICGLIISRLAPAAVLRAHISN